MSSNLPCIIIGGSHAGGQLALSLRQEGWTDDIIVISNEAYYPYQRPPLSKALLAGKLEPHQILIRPQALYEKQNISFLFNTSVEKINRQNKRLELDNGNSIDYQKLALCTGARARKLEICGAELSGIHYLRSLDDVEHIKADLNNQLKPQAKPSSIVIVGGGYIGLEAAASFTQLGHKVTVVEAANRVLQRVTAPEVSNFFTRLHESYGVSIIENKQVAEFLKQTESEINRVHQVLFSDGTVLPADIVIVGIGVRPNVELAEQSGLEVKNGICVNEFAQTSDDNIVAAGDCTLHPNTMYQTSIRLESVPNAMEQAKSAAAMICGKQKKYDALPWFWSDQYDVKLQIAGLNQGYDQTIIRGDSVNTKSFVVWYLKNNQVIAADCINRPREFMFAKRLITQKILANIAQLSDDTFDLSSLFS
ncbi:MAG: NAD(P)/FAD-dependent oxidoreductase [Gammaproteobacteria bacterium]|nr:NAD(P)/FAD-dependent oxidoreductase [Gammaproteobacteria bacterium]